jgi:hypothetical protein
MELVLGLDDIKHLRGRHHTEKLVVIGLLDVLQFQLIDITFLHSFLALCLIDRLDLTFFLDLTLDGTLLLMHLTEERKELCRLFRGKTGLLSNKLLHLRLEFLRGEFLRFVSKG